MSKPPPTSRPSARRRARAADHDPLAVLDVFDSLEVGPVRIEKDRLTAPYRLTVKGRSEATELVYAYEEKVFDAADPLSQNLAAMITAQVALNYGLFCQRMLFHGPFDHADRRLLVDMAANTAREIYVKKFLEPNPFLVGDALGLPARQQRSYLRAALEFPTPSPRSGAIPWALWPTAKDRHAVLSSGGKDSLLTYGLLTEMGKEVHPIYVNESGRHWLTALNAYRHFSASVPRTARVWVNSDRVFAWFLRRMPFIRQDFASIRSDEYPIRLWTVAVFLFGTLPLLSKRGIGRLSIGDEYDTTNRTKHAGITHYDGLYDQSRYFDMVMSRYFLRKGWSISQFSILRPLSEMLIEKVLVERYPELQSLQMSCHAAHKEGDRVRPCGKCEKCRRIVGMLKVLDADPGRSGYSEDQVRQCLQAIAERGVYQEAPGAEHLIFTLRAKGLLPAGKPGSPREEREHPEILKLRFDRQRSPVDTIPQDLRAPLYRILSGHATGAARLEGGRANDFDPLASDSLAAPYPFELSALPQGSPSTGSATAADRGSRYLWGEFTWPDVEARLKRVDIALLPVGSIEQHGPHLPLDTDLYDADYLARRVAEACSEPKPLVLPAIPYGVSYHHEGFKGTISVSNESLSRLVYEIGMSVARSGIRKLVIINGHGGNAPSLNHAAQQINRDAHIFVCVDTGETSDVDIERLAETPNDVHAGEIETSTTLATRPHLVQTERLERRVPTFSNRYLSFSSQRGVSWYTYTRKLSPTGVIGDPTKASADKGAKMWEIMVSHLVALTEDLKRLSLEEIYQPRY